MIDLNAVAIFVSVVDAGSFTGGAKALGLPKGSVSRKISALEAELCVRLLNRTTRKLSLTDSGRAYYEQSRNGLSQLDTAQRLVGETQSVPGGILRISAPADSGNGALADWIDAFLSRYERTRVEVLLSDQYVDLIEQRVDVAIRSGRLQDSTFVARKLAPARRILCANPDYIRRRGEPNSVDDLESHDAIVHGSSVDGMVWQLSGPEGDVSVAVKARIAGQSMGLVSRAALSGLGIALIPEAIVRDDLKAERLVHLLDQYGTSGQGLYAVYPSKRQLSANVRAFLDIIVEMTTSDVALRPHLKEESKITDNV